MMEAMLGTKDATQDVIKSLLFLANHADKSGLKDVSRRLAATLEDITDWADANGQCNSPLPIPPPISSRRKK